MLSMERIPEPEIMGAEEEAKVYDLADFSEVNQAFANRVLDLVHQSSGVLLDCGCGPGDILMRIHTSAPKFFLIGFDGSQAMIALAVKRIREQGLQNTIHFVQGDAKKINFSPNSLDVVISNSLIHHLLDPRPFWEEIRRVCKPGGIVLIRDLSRPPTPEVAWDIVEKYSGTEPQLLKDLFFQSLKASFTVAEVRDHLAQASLHGLAVKMCSDRHWEVSGKIEK
jgi:Methylase involved in ubiquinone/menaquinone biosynthesis